MLARTLLVSLFALCACGGDDSSADLATCGAITCPSNEVADRATCSCKPAVDASVPHDLAETD